MNLYKGIIHIIKPGEDLERVSKLYNVKLTKILNHNPNTSFRPAVGNKVFIPRKDEQKINKTDIDVDIEGIELDNLPVLNYKTGNDNYLYIPVSYLDKLGLNININNEKLEINPNENQLSNKVKQLETVNTELKKEINRLKSFPKDVPIETDYDHIFSSNPEFFIYYGKKRFTDSVEDNKFLRELVEMTQSNGIRANWVYYPTSNQIYMYISFMSQRLGLNNFDSDKVHNLMGSAYEVLHKDFEKITKDNTIRLEISYIFVENIEGYDVQRSIYINEDNVDNYKKNTRKF